MWWSNLFAGMSPANFFNFSFLPKYLSFFVQGLEYTLLLSIISVGLAVIPALALALMRLSRNKIVRNLSGAYIAVFRSTPMMVQLYIIFYGLFSVIKIPSVVILGFIDLSRFIPGVVALALNSSAYVAEIIRAAIQSIDKGQLEASTALGLTHSQAMRLVIIPQAYRRMIPPICNEFVMVLKDTSLVSIIALTDLTYQTKIIASNKASALVYIPAMIIYLIITGVFTVIFNRLEKRLSIYE